MPLGSGPKKLNFLGQDIAFKLEKKIKGDEDF